MSLKNKLFRKEIDKPIDVDLKTEFYKLITKKRVTKLTDIEMRALFYRALLLSNDERKVFKKFLVVDNMTEKEELRYRRILPNHIFDKNFPKQENN